MDWIRAASAGSPTPMTSPGMSGRAGWELELLVTSHVIGNFTFENVLPENQTRNLWCSRIIKYIVKHKGSPLDHVVKE